MRSRALTSAVVPALALPAFILGHGGGHLPILQGLGITRATHAVTSTVSSATALGKTSASAKTSAAKRSAKALRYVAINCLGNPVVRPATFVLACADYNDSLTKLHWTTWSAGYATATGNQVVNDCTPNCAQGKFKSYPVRAIFWGTATVPGHSSERRYAKITLLYTGRQPTASTPSATGDLWS
jgi:hypothetical protein